MAAPTIPAAPACTDWAPLGLADPEALAPALLAEAAVVRRVVVPAAGVVAGVVAPVVPVGGAGAEVNAEVEPPAGGVPAAVPLVEAPPGAAAPELEGWPLPTHDVSLPVKTLNGADCAVSPVLSRMVSPILVPAAMSATHLKLVDVSWSKLSRAVALGWFPGRMLRKYGGVPPTHVN